MRLTSGVSTLSEYCLRKPRHSSRRIVERIIVIHKVSIPKSSLSWHFWIIRYARKILWQFSYDLKYQHLNLIYQNLFLNPNRLIYMWETKYEMFRSWTSDAQQDSDSSQNEFLWNIHLMYYLITKKILYFEAQNDVLYLCCARLSKLATETHPPVVGMQTEQALIYFFFVCTRTLKTVKVLAAPFVLILARYFPATECRRTLVKICHRF